MKLLICLVFVIVGIEASSIVINDKLNYVEDLPVPIFPIQFSTIVEFSTIVTINNSNSLPQYDAEAIYRWNYDDKLKAARVDYLIDNDVYTFIYNGIANTTTVIDRTSFECFVSNGTEDNYYAVNETGIWDFTQFTYAGTTMVNFLEVNKWQANYSGHYREYYEESISRRPVVTTYKQNRLFTTAFTFIGFVEEPQDPSLFVVPPALAAKCLHVNLTSTLSLPQVYHLSVQSLQF